MITAGRDSVEEGRGGYALSLLESSGYIEPWKSSIADEINDGSVDEIDLIIEDLLLNQVDNWNNFRPRKDIDRRLTERLKRC